MNQTQVKEILLEIKDDVEEFDLIFSGKKSLRVDGLYKPDIRQIIIHNRNTDDENALIYTAIHEFAHHVHITTSAVPVSRRAHTKEFWAILHGLLETAEQKGLYNNKFRSLEPFKKLTKEIKTNFLVKNGQLMKEFGKLLLKAFQLCREYDMSFDDYADRELGFGRNEAKKLMQIYSEGINPEVGYPNMQTLLRIRNTEDRQRAERDFLEGKSPDFVKTAFVSGSGKREEDPARVLQKEKQRIERSITSLSRRLEEINRNLQRLRGHKDE